jgi:hypothetical protein
LRVARTLLVLGAAAALGGIVGCTTLPGGGDPHPGSGQPADAFSMARPRCAAQGREPVASLKEPLRGVRIGGHQLYRGASITCE